MALRFLNAAIFAFLKDVDRYGGVVHYLNNLGFEELFIGFRC